MKVKEDLPLVVQTPWKSPREGLMAPASSVPVSAQQSKEKTSKACSGVVFLFR